MVGDERVTCPEPENKPAQLNRPAVNLGARSNRVGSRVVTDCKPLVLNNCFKILGGNL